MSYNSEYKWMTGFLLGAAMGAMGTLLMAPKSGRELRQDIVDEKNRLRRRAGEAAADMRNRANETAGEIKNRGKRALERTKEAAAHTATGVKKAARVIREGEPSEPVLQTS